MPKGQTESEKKRKKERKLLSISTLLASFPPQYLREGKNKKVCIVVIVFTLFVVVVVGWGLFCSFESTVCI